MTTVLPTSQLSPVWRRIADDLAQAIANGSYGANDPLPTALVLAERYGVHRHTVRQAFRHLQDIGLVSVEQGRGTFVRAARVPYRLGRRVSFRANLGAQGLEASGEVISGDIEPADAATAQALGIAPGAPVWRIRTLNHAGGRPLSTGQHWLCATRFADMLPRLQEAGASMTAALRSYGIDDYQRLTTRLSARGATAEEAGLLNIAIGSPVLASHAHDGLSDQRPIHIVDAAFAGERVEMVVERD